MFYENHSKEAMRFIIDIYKHNEVELCYTTEEEQN